MEKEQTFESGMEDVSGMDPRSIYLGVSSGSPRHLAALAGV